ncbi:hypothetical protein [Bradyrhizobium glycinis]|uniref:hypothetical protein n=1 Tax=Bradyrhizobium glycinis TaxID=2751812 RepID=UPI0018D65C85|nr:hypothetical protein [Bradyrhizobium glycinis]MBH5371423.1 hypothetical protein [Bradyrhizobium glycinis]
MSERPEMPYEKAITETAKATGKVVDLVDKASPAIGNIYDWMIGDRIAQARERNLDHLQRKTKRIIEERDLVDKTTRFRRV